MLVAKFNRKVTAITNAMSFLYPRYLVETQNFASPGTQLFRLNVYSLRMGEPQELASLPCGCILGASPVTMPGGFSTRRVSAFPMQMFLYGTVAVERFIHIPPSRAHISRNGWLRTGCQRLCAGLCESGSSRNDCFPFRLDMFF